MHLVCRRLRQIIASIKVPQFCKNLYFCWSIDFDVLPKLLQLFVSTVAIQQQNRRAKSPRFLRFVFCIAATACAIMSPGCGTTTNRSGTEQLLISDAVDNAVAKLDFHEMMGHKVFFDTSFMRSVQSDNFINDEYVISAIRQQLAAAGALVQDSRRDADTIVEARVGAMGTDGHEITYGIPKTGGLSAAASVLSSSPVASLPEISFAQTNSQAGVAKVIVFAYDKKTKEPIWQSGVAKAESNCSHTWVLGAGPFEKGSIYEGKRFAGKKIGTNGVLPKPVWARKNAPRQANNDQLSYRNPYSFQRSTTEYDAVELASAEEDIASDEDNDEEKSSPELTH